MDSNLDNKNNSHYICKKCGTEVLVRSNFCTNCGTPMNLDISDKNIDVKDKLGAYGVMGIISASYLSLSFPFLFVIWILLIVLYLTKTSLRPKFNSFFRGFGMVTSVLILLSLISLGACLFLAGVLSS